jgi:hypothetical protein
MTRRRRDIKPIANKPSPRRPKVDAPSGAFGAAGRPKRGQQFGEMMQK